MAASVSKANGKGKTNGKANGSGLLTRGSVGPRKTVYTTTRKYVRKTATHGGGRPRKHKIDWKLVARLARLHCTQEEIATALDMPRSTLITQPEFLTIYKKGFDKGATSVRRKQLNMALSRRGNATMLIWLGKQWLGQGDTPPRIEAAPMTSAYNLDVLSLEEQQELLTILRKASIGPQTMLPQGAILLPERELES